MGQIRRLSPELVGKIAAGEVVERPASIVKELIENALDAGARSLRVDIAEGGKTRIVVTDDGSGMDPDDARCCLDRHATSKVRCEDDLWSISTFGFRGEALAAIAAVSRLTIETKLHDTQVIEGIRVQGDGAGNIDTFLCGCPGGTRVEVRDLFFNVPARLKFLKSEAVEYGHIVEAVQAAAIAHPELRVELVRDDRVQWVLAPTSLEQRVVDTVGAEETFRCFEETSDGISCAGWLTTGEMHRPTSKNLWLFVNRRPLRDKLLLHAVTHGFGETLPRGRYPVGAVFLSIDPRKIDVNVHPTKREVRFENGGAVHDFVAKVVRKSFQQAVQKGPAARPPEEAGRVVLEAYVAGRADEGNEADGLFQQSALPVRVLGQLAKTYIVCEGPENSLVLFDQHAAHERLGFNILKQQFSSGSVAQQRLLIPQQVALSPAAAARLRESIDVLQRAGFEVEPFSGTSFSVKAVPALLGDADLSSLLEQVAHELEEAGSSNATQALFDRLFSVVACHRQIRGGDTLASQEMAALLRDVEQHGITHCPHGRPVLITFDRGEIERRFKRT
ncbi:MAG: DNA mismatch repair endonuclease MutL [Deltaproteobacteria bacterium]|nr:DNA mismatch repair endonuclease MutL [Deltaproteobacteria bacterium]